MLHSLKERRAIENSYFARQEMRREHWDGSAASGPVLYVTARVLWILMIPVGVLFVYDNEFPGAKAAIDVLFFLVGGIGTALLVWTLYVRWAEAEEGG